MLNYVQIGLLVLILFLIYRKTDSPMQKKEKMVLDTCALIDGRILEVVKAGFAPKNIIIPEFIINELQLLADGQDSHKRERARFGLDVAKLLQDTEGINIKVKKYDVGADLPTDNRLVLLAKKLSADLCTTDYNLNKVAALHKVRVLNVNELSNSVRPVALPGEQMQIKIVQKGSNKNQGVGYLEDGSMIVVEGASNMVGRTVKIEISRYIQTDAGKMLFANRVSGKK